MSQVAALGVQLLGYDDTADALDAHRLRTISPLLSRENVDVVALFPKMLMVGRVSSLMCAPVIIAGNEQGTSRPLLSRLFEAILSVEPGAYAKNNLYAMRGLPFMDATWTILNATSVRAASRSAANSDGGLRVGRPEASILEQFADAPSSPYPSVEGRIVPSRNVHGFVEYHGPSRTMRTMRIASLRIDGVPVRVNDRVRLTAQVRPEENGDYFVTAADPGASVLNSPAPVRSDSTMSFDKARAGTDGMWRVWIPADSVAPLRLLIGDKVAMMTAKVGTVEAVDVESKRILVRTIADPDVDAAEKFHPLALCSVDPLIPVRELCTTRGGIWDRPCETNTDCPFFQANRTYRNYRGGCVAGYCELPVGMKRAGYRNFQKDAKPLCHGCPDAASAECCELQQKPDYAFEMDEFERLRS
eukprot:gene17734-24094_t